MIGIFGLAGIGLAIFGEYYKAAPLKTSDILWGSSTRLEDFWDKFAKDQKKSDNDIYRDLNIFIRKDRKKRIDAFRKIEASRNGRIRLYLCAEWAGVAFFTLFTFFVLTAAHQQNIPNADKKNSIIGNADVNNHAYAVDENASIKPAEKAK